MKLVWFFLPASPTPGLTCAVSSRILQNNGNSCLELPAFPAEMKLDYRGVQQQRSGQHVKNKESESK